jgi:hypothetical protein
MSGGTIRWLTVWMMLVLLSTPAFAQKKNKNAGKDDGSSLPMPPIPVPDELDHNIGEMLGAWQV